MKNGRYPKDGSLERYREIANTRTEKSKDFVSPKPAKPRNEFDKKSGKE